MKTKVLAAIFASIASFVVYLFTLVPNAYWRDSAEFIHASYTLDITHPSGSPLFLHIAKLLQFSPLGSIAFRTNLTSALLTAIGIGLLALLLMTIAEDIGFSKPEASICAAAIAMWFGFSGAVWEWAIASEVYGLNLVFLVLIFTAAWLVEKTRDPSAGAIMAFLSGIATGIHPTFILFIPVVAIFLILSFWESKERLRAIAILALAGALGCLIIFYAPFRSRANPLEDYGDPQNFSMFLSYITGQSVQSRITEYPLVCGLKNLGGIFKYTANEFLLWPLVFSLFGIVYALLKQPRYLFLTVGLALVNWYSVKDWTLPFGYIPLIFALILLSFFGIAMVISSIQRSKALSAYITPAVTGILIGLMLVCAVRNFNANEKHSHALTEAHGYRIFSSMPYGSIFLVNHGPTIFLSLYQQSVLGYRQDIEMIPEPYLYHRAGLAQRHPMIMQGYTSSEPSAVASWLQQQLKTRSLFVNTPIAFEKLLGRPCNVEGPFVFSCTTQFAKIFNPLFLISRYISDHYYKYDYSAQELIASYADMLGAVSYGKGNKNEAKRWFNLSMLLTDTEPSGSYNLAQIELLDGNCKAAIGHATIAYSRRPCFILASPPELLCRALYECKRFEQAKPICKEAVQLNPSSEKSKYFYATSLLLAGDRTSGLKNLEQIFWESKDQRFIKSCGLILFELAYFSELQRDEACSRLMQAAPEDKDVKKFCAQGKTR